MLPAALTLLCITSLALGDAVFYTAVSGKPYKRDRLIYLAIAMLLWAAGSTGLAVIVRRLVDNRGVL